MSYVIHKYSESESQKQLHFCSIGHRSHTYQQCLLSAHCMQAILLSARVQSSQYYVVICAAAALISVQILIDADAAHGVCAL